MELTDIIAKLPYSKPFLFVDELLECSENCVVGKYTFDPGLDFYKGHFTGHPVTPGVILTEAMAQIGVVCLGIYLIRDEPIKDIGVALTSTEVEFLKPVYPGETVTVESEKLYFRFGKLKCSVVMKNNNNDEVCRGTIAGMIRYDR